MKKVLVNERVIRSADEGNSVHHVSAQVKLICNNLPTFNMDLATSWFGHHSIATEQAATTEQSTTSTTNQSVNRAFNPLGKS